MKVAFVMPTYFDKGSVIAGGERYAHELAKAMSRQAETTLFTFADQPETYRDGVLTVVKSRALFRAGAANNPFSASFLAALREFDVIHCLQHRTLVTELALLVGSLFGKKIFVTDLSGGSHRVLSRFFPIWKRATAFLYISEFNRSCNPGIRVPSRIIPGGVDANIFTPSPVPRERSGFLFVGRITRFKGIHDLIDALPTSARLRIAGQCREPEYLKELKEKSRGKNVEFLDAPSDRELLELYRSSIATVLPSLADGGYTTALESMACETPVIGARLGSLPEILIEGQTGYLVPPGDIPALREKLSFALSNPSQMLSLGKQGRSHVVDQLTWDQLASRCLAAYRNDPEKVAEAA